MSVSINVFGKAHVVPDRAIISAPAEQRGPGKGGEFDALLLVREGQEESRPEPRTDPVHSLPGLQYAPHGVLDAGFEVDAAGRRFDLVASFASSAVAFEARPIFGPAAINLPHEPEAAAPAGMHPAQSEAALTEHRRASGQPFPSAGNTSGVDVKTPAQDLGGRPVDRPAKGGAAASVNMSGALVRSSVGTTTNYEQSPVAPDEAFPLADNLATEGADLPLGGRTLEGQAHAARSQMLASLLASADDYRVLVRGVALDQRKQRALAKAVKSALREFGLPDRPVIISTPERED